MSRSSNSLILATSFIAGTLLALSFAPFEFWWLAIISLGLFFHIQLEKPPKSAFLSGLAFGLGLYLVGISWVYNSLHVYGGMPLWMGAIAVFLFSLLLAMFVAVPSWLAACIFKNSENTSLAKLSSASVLISLWLIFEWSKSWVLTGFPWLDVGYSQTSGVLFGLAPFGGVYLVSFMLLLSSATLALLINGIDKKHRAVLCITMIFCWSGAWFGLKLDWTQPQGEKIHVGVVQPNTAINQKWQGHYRDAVIKSLASLTRDLNSEAATTLDFVVWPETALPLYFQQTDADFWRQIVPNSVSVLTGMIDRPNYHQTFNAAVLHCAGESQLYRKQHLVPFGEYMPLRFLFGWVLDYLNLPMSDLSAWAQPQTLACGAELNIGLSICYEDAFAEEHRISNNKANFLVNISEDAWFGDSFAPHQRLQMGQMRARELAKPMVRSANSGPSAFISHLGEVEAQSPQFTPTTLRHSVQPRQGRTPFSIIGNWIVWVAMLYVAQVVYRLRMWRKLRRSSKEVQR